MLEQIKIEEAVDEVIQYIGENYKTTPYMYLNIIKYGTGTDDVHSWIDRGEDGSIEGVYLLYYDCIHFYTNDSESYPVKRIHDFINKTTHKVVMLQGVIGDRIDKELSGYHSERNYIIDMDKVGVDAKEFRSKIASREDVVQIVDLLMADPEYIEVYDRDTLLRQMLDRYDGGFSRFFIVKTDGKIVASCSTYGEVPGFALVGGVIVHPEYRRQGLAGDVESYACHVLAEEGASKVAFVNYHNGPSLALHEKIGGRSFATLAKFVKKA